MDKLDIIYSAVADLRDKVFVNEEDCWFDGCDITPSIVGSPQDVLHFTMKLLERLEKERYDQVLVNMKSKYELK